MVRLLALALSLPTAAMANTPTLEDADLRVRGDALAFVLKGSAPIAPEAVETAVVEKGLVLVIRVRGVTGTRRYLKLNEEHVLRALLEPVEGPKPAAIIRVRMRKRLAQRMGWAIRVFTDGDNLRIEVPRTVQAAEAWTAGKQSKTEGGGDAPPPTVSGPGSREDQEAEYPPTAPVGPITNDPAGGLDELALYLHRGLASRKNMPRVVVLPFATMDDASREARLGALSSELLQLRLFRHRGLLPADDVVLRRLLERVSREGRLSPEEGLAAAKMLGADTLVIGQVEANGSGVLVRARAIDAASERQVVGAEQEFGRQAFLDFRDDVAVHHSRLGAAARSAVVPGWGQIYNGDLGRGVLYVTGFIAALAGTAGSLTLGVQNENDYDETGDLQSRRNADFHYDRTNLFLIALGSVWTAAVIDAFVSGEDRHGFSLESYGERK